MIDPRAEIWESFVSLLRCYAAAASLPGSEYHVMQADGVAHLEYEERVLSFHFQPSSGDATWHLNGAGTQSRGTFHMREDSTLEFAGETKELDIAAIDFIEKLAEDSAETQTELPSAALSSSQTNVLTFPLRADFPARRHHATTRGPVTKKSTLPFVSPAHLYRKFAAVSKHSQSKTRSPKP